MSHVSLRRIHKRFGQAEVLHGIDLEIPAGEMTVLLGPSGCGKSTLLRMIAGLEAVTSGEILIGGRRVNDVPAKDRGCAMVFQNYALYPHLTVYNNLAFPLSMANMRKPEVDRRVRETATLLQIEPYLDRLPKALSGGQRQRVAMGRAIIREPQVYLFDEPLSNLDAELRVRMRLEITRLQKSLGATMIFVTHDQVEAMTLAHRIVVMRAGLIEQVGAPLDIYRRPANRFVGGFLGSPAMNILPVTEVETAAGRSTIVLAPGARLEVPMRLGTPPAAIGIRPEHVTLNAPAPGTTTLTVAPSDVQALGTEHLGDRAYRYFALPFGEISVLVADSQGAEAAGGPVRLTFDPQHIHFFGPDGAAIAAA